MHRECGSLRAGGSPASLDASSRIRDTDCAMVPARVVALNVLRAEGLGAVRKVAAPTPSPLVPSAVSQDYASGPLLSGCSRWREPILRSD